MKIFDAHNDFLTELSTNQQQYAYAKNLSRQRFCTTILAQVWTTNLKKPIKFLSESKHKLDVFNSSFCSKHLHKTKCKFVLAIEDLGFISQKNVHTLLPQIVKFRPFSCTIVWNNPNPLGGGANAKGGLTKLGKHVVETLEQNGIVVDTAHMNEQTFWDFAKITQKPLFNSHTNIFELHHHKRNLTHKQIEAVVNSGGLVCVSAVQDFIKNGKFFAKDLANQIAFFVKKYGAKHLAIGTDFFGTTHLPANFNRYIDFFTLKNELQRLKISRHKIHAIFYKNLNKFYHRFCHKG